MPTRAETRQQQRAHLATLVAVLLDQPQVKTPHGIGKLTMISAERTKLFPHGIVYVQFPADHIPKRYADTEPPLHPRQVSLLL